MFDVNFTKGQLISKCLLGVFNFLQKTNENKYTYLCADIIVVKLNSCFVRNINLKKIISTLSDLYKHSHLVDKSFVTNANKKQFQWALIGSID